MCISHNSLKNLKVCDVFAGIGGNRLGFEKNGAKCVFSSEINKSAAAVYEANFGDRPHGDITKINSEDIPDFDILVGGFPCQSFSCSGNRKGFEDTRGILFFELVRLAKEKQPKVVFMEDVPGLLVHDKGKTFEVVRNTMESIGYDFYYKLINAADFGVPQARERVYMVCFRKDLNIKSFKFPVGTGRTKCVRDILEPTVDVPEEYYIKRKDLTFYDCKPKPAGTHRIGYFGKKMQGMRIFDISYQMPTLCSSTGSELILVDGRIRRLTPRECARVDGFPESFKIAESKTAAYRQFGNSVCVPVIEKIAGAIGKALVETTKKKIFTSS